MLNISYEKCYNEAKKYDTLKDFNNKNPAYSSFAYIKGWMKTFTWLKRTIHQKGYWGIYENCYNEAKKYKNRREFHDSNRRAYDSSVKNNWIDTFTWMPNIKDEESKVDSVYCYIFEDLKSVYVGRTLMIRQERRHNSHKTDVNDSVYKFSIRNNVDIPSMTIIEDNLTVKEGLIKEDLLIKEYREKGYFIINKAKTGINSGSVGAINNGKWDYTACYNLAKTCKSRSEFAELSYRAFFNARKNNWLKDYVWFVPYQEDCDYWNKERCFKIAQSCENKMQFSLKAPGAYKVSVRNNWINEYIWFKTDKTPYKWTYDATINEAKKYKSKIEFKERNGAAYKAAQRNGWLSDYTWMSRPDLTRKWTYENCYNEAKKYLMVGDFSNKSGGAYKAALRNKWLDDYIWFKKRKNNKKKNEEK